MKNVAYRFQRLRLLALCLCVCGWLAFACAENPEPPADTSRDLGSEPVTVRIVGISEWAGQLDPVGTGLGMTDVEVGGAAYLASWWDRERSQNPASVFVAAGDSFGTSPPLSSFFEEEPAVVVLGQMGLNVDTLGNHNFDRGIEHLQRMIDLSSYSYLAANLTNVPQNIRGVAPYSIRDLGGVPVAIIGVTSPEAPTLVFPGSFGTMSVSDPVAAAVEARELAAAAGATVFVVTAHLYTESDGEGPMMDFARGLQEAAPGAFDLIVGDAADDDAMLCVVAPDGSSACQTSPGEELVTSVSLPLAGLPIVHNRSRARSYSRVELTVVPRTGEVTGVTVEFVVPVISEVEPDPLVEEALEPFVVELAETFDEPVAVVEARFETGEDGTLVRSQEMPIGNLIADSLRGRYDTDLAVVNAGGIRDTWPSNYEPLDPDLRRSSAPWDLVIGDVDAALPFINQAVTQQVTGAEIWAMLENSVREIPAGRFLQVSGVRFWFDGTAEPGSRVCAVQGADGGVIAADSTPYVLATIDFLAQGGDGYLSLTNDQGRARELLTDVVIEEISGATLRPADFLDPDSPRIVDVNGQLDECPSADSE